VCAGGQDDHIARGVACSHDSHCSRVAAARGAGRRPDWRFAVSGDSRNCGEWSCPQWTSMSEDQRRTHDCRGVEWRQDAGVQDRRRGRADQLRDRGHARTFERTERRKGSTSFSTRSAVPTARSRCEQRAAAGSSRCSASTCLWPRLPQPCPKCRFEVLARRIFRKLNAVQIANAWQLLKSIRNLLTYRWLLAETFWRVRCSIAAHINR